MGSNTLGEILENAQMGRENALLGNYDTAVVYYQGVLQQIQKQMIQIPDPYMKQKWQVVWCRFVLFFTFIAQVPSKADDRPNF